MSAEPKQPQGLVPGRIVYYVNDDGAAEAAVIIDVIDEARA